MTWFTFVGAGSDPKPARGPYRSANEVNAAFLRFCERHGANAGTYLAAGSIRIYGYSTRAFARRADISDCIGKCGRIK